jgi:hypothetical protein
MVGGGRNLRILNHVVKLNVKWRAEAGLSKVGELLKQYLILARMLCVECENERATEIKNLIWKLAT